MKSKCHYSGKFTFTSGAFPRINKKIFKYKHSGNVGSQIFTPKFR